MKDFKLIRVLEKLSVRDLQQLELFIVSPYFKFKEDNVLFISKLIKIKDLGDSDFQKTWASTCDIQFSEKRLRKKLYECLQMVEKFLTIEEFQQQSISSDKVFLETVVNKNIDDLISKALKQLKTSLDAEKRLSYDYYSSRYFLYNTHINLPGFDRKIAIKKNKDSSEYLLKADKILNEIFLSEKLRLAHLLENDNSVSNKDDQLTFMNEVFEFANKTARRGSKPYFYMQLIELSNSKDKLTEIKKLHNYVSKRNFLFSNFEFRNIVLTLINEAIRLSNAGNKSANSVLFNLWKIGLESNSFIINSVLLPDTFRNICFDACRVQEYDWALDFIEEYKTKLSPKFQNTAVAFNKARIYTNLKKYESVISELRNVEFEDLLYNRTTKLMLLVSYYELDETDALDSLLKSFNVYLRRKTNLTQAVKSSFKNFNSSLQDIVRVKERRDKVKLRTLRQKLESKMIAPNKDWLLEKVEELEKELGVVREVVSEG